MGIMDSEGFDKWSDTYDAAKHDAPGSLFEKYTEVLDFIFRSLPQPQGKSVLDIGIGSGVLAERFCKSGSKVVGLDFSERMLEKARARLPEAEFVLHDFAKPLPQSLRGVRYDLITLTYSIHHLTDAAKVRLLNELSGLLADGGRIMIGDVVFVDEAAREKCSGMLDPDEFYIVLDKFLPLAEHGGLFVSCIHRIAGHCAVLTMTSMRN